MRRVMVSYKVKPEHVDENVRLVEAVYTELEQTEPEGLRYSTHRLEDGVTFVHLAFSDDGPPKLTGLEAFKRFQSGIADRCDEPPAVTRLQRIGSYGFGD
jgi:hypothetical protein